MLCPRFGQPGLPPHQAGPSNTGPRALSITLVTALHVLAILVLLLQTRLVPTPVELPLQVAMVEMERPPETMIPPLPTFQPSLSAPRTVNLPLPELPVAPPQPAAIRVAAASASAPVMEAVAGSPESPAARAEGLPPDYLALLMNHLGKAKRYPMAARRLRQQGVVHVRFTMSRAGRVVAASLEKESRFEALNAEAIELLYRAMPLPRLPDDLPDLIELVIPVEFSLR